MPINTKPKVELPVGNQLTDKMLSFEAVQPLYTLNDLIVPKNTLKGITDFLSYQKHSDLVYNQWGLSKTHSHLKQIAINLYGLPGTGKTMAAHAIASALKRPMFAVNYADVESKYVGETSKNLTRLFKEAELIDAIIFFDEADAMLSRRVTNMSNSTDVSVNQTRSVLLTLMNNHKGLIIFTTNFIENYDPAFMRRIISHIYFDLPDLENRKILWDRYIPNSLPHSADLSELAKSSEGLSGSDIANIVLKSALSAASNQQSEVSMANFNSAINEIKNSKIANQKAINHSSKIQTNIVSQEYVHSQLGV